MPDDEEPRRPRIAPLDDRLDDIRHTRKKVQELADQIRDNLSRNTWGPNKRLRYAA